MHLKNIFKKFWFLNLLTYYFLLFKRKIKNNSVIKNL